MRSSVMLKKFLLPIILTVAGLLFFTVNAYAAISLTPAYVSGVGSPGNAGFLPEYLIVNSSDSTFNISIFLESEKNGKIPAGYYYAQPAVFALKPHSQQTVTIKLTIPGNFKLGDYNWFVTAMAQPVKSNPFQFNLILRGRVNLSLKNRPILTPQHQLVNFLAAGEDNKSQSFSKDMKVTFSVNERDDERTGGNRSEANELTEEGTDAVGNYADIKHHWAESIIQSLIASRPNASLNSTNFKPDAPMSRAEVAELLTRVLNLDISAGSSSFADVPIGEIYNPAVSMLARLKIIRGDENNLFIPDKMASRQEAVVIIKRLINYYKPELNNAPPSMLSSYQDAAIIAPWAQESFAFAVANGIINGRSNTELAPLEPTTRAELAVMLFRTLRLLEQIENA